MCDGTSRDNEILDDERLQPNADDLPARSGNEQDMPGWTFFCLHMKGRSYEMSGVSAGYCQMLSTKTGPGNFI